MFLACSTAALGDLIIDEENGIALDVMAWTGEGDYTSFLVVDFEATGGGSYAFGYLWDEGGTVLDMMDALSSSTELVAITTSYGEWGTFLDNFTYGEESGNPSNYWSHSLASPDGSGTVEWTSAGGGVEVELLTDGGISGWYNGFTDDYQTIPPSLPQTSVPAPAALPLCLVALATRSRSRKRTRLPS